MILRDGARPEDGATDIGRPAAGSEMHWAAISGEQPHSMYNDLAGHLLQGCSWDYGKLDINQHLGWRARLMAAC